MVLLDDLRLEALDLQKQVKELYDVLDIDKAKKDYDDLQKEIAKDGFWDDLENSQKTLQKSKTLENKIKDLETKYKSKIDNLEYENSKLNKIIDKFKTNFKIFLTGTIKILPNKNKKHIHAKYVITFVSNPICISPILKLLYYIFFIYRQTIFQIFNKMYI